MQLELRRLEIGKIKIDKDNPRFVSFRGESQEELVKSIMSQQEGAKALLNSMKEKIRWVNMIVVRRIPHEADNYIVVEGNTRMACLKSGMIENYTSETDIPVLEAIREASETEEQFIEQIRVTQGIANVSVVKEWPALAKARHLFKMFSDLRSNDDPPTKTIKKIADTLAMTANEVRNAVKRYAFYREIEKEALALESEEWSYLEGITKNDQTRKFFGFNDETYSFEWENVDEPSDEVEEMRTRLGQVHKLFRAPQRITTQEFRDKFDKLIKSEDPEAKFEDLCEGRITWDNIGSDSLSSKEQWITRLTSAYRTISEFPNMAEWSTETDVKDLLEKIKKSINKQIMVISED